MTSITVKNIPDELYDRLRMSAQTNRRSLNSEILACIEMAVRSQPVDPETFLKEARLLRERSQKYAISDEEFNQSKRQGRK